jgi:hypothetical protein
VDIRGWVLAVILRASDRHWAKGAVGLATSDEVPMQSTFARGDAREMLGLEYVLALAVSTGWRGQLLAQMTCSS